MKKNYKIKIKIKIKIKKWKFDKIKNETGLKFFL